MSKEYIFRNSAETLIIGRILYIPPTIKAFYDRGGDYVLEEREVNGFWHLVLWPSREISDLLLAGGISEELAKQLTPIKKITRQDGVMGLIIPESFPQYSLEYLASKGVVLVTGEFDCMGVWKLTDFKKYTSSDTFRQSFDLEAAELGISIKELEMVID
ncbi:hypothetical protein HYX03_03190 [Candidatus Woesearchaeota archaeon]|nr:hypothetical protein [Candidatus Woesearchaeota archaeon]